MRCRGSLGMDEMGYLTLSEVMRLALEQSGGEALARPGLLLGFLMDCLDLDSPELRVYPQTEVAEGDPHTTASYLRVGTRMVTPPWAAPATGGSPRTMRPTTAAGRRTLRPGASSATIPSGGACSK